MMRNYSVFFLALTLTLFISSCGKQVELPGFEYEKFQNDKLACDGRRAEMEPKLREVKDLLLKASEKDIIETLGAPDQNELYIRSQKYYIYFLTPATECRQEDSSNTVKILRIRFNSTGYANEAVILERKRQ